MKARSKETNSLCEAYEIGSSVKIPEWIDSCIQESYGDYYVKLGGFRNSAKKGDYAVKECLDETVTFLRIVKQDEFNAEYEVIE